MPPKVWTLAAAAFAAIAHAVTLDDVCTVSYAKASLPSDNFYLGITIDPSSVIATPVTNAVVSGQDMYPDAVFDYCNVTFAYSHNGRNDQVLVTYWLPAPANFQNRYLSTGGGGLAITSGSGSLPGGIIYGAVAGTTDGGFGSFSTQSDAVFLLQNGTVNWQSVFMFGYQAHHELSTLGKEFTKQFFNMSSTKLYSYYQGCSEGGREGWSQVQRFGDEWDGAVTGAPALRFSFQQIQHLYSNVVEQTMDYYPPPCELEKIVNETIAACDPMDGKTDGVVARTDLCKLYFNVNSTIGRPYYCAATGSLANAKRQMPMSAPTPAQNGTVTAKGVAVANEIISGLHDLQGRRVYISYQPAASFVDAQTTYNSASNTWGATPSGIGAEFVTRYLDLLNTSSLANLDGVTYDTLKAWIYDGWQRYEDTLHTTWPDLTPFHTAGGKVLHYHGESDNSIPTASSVRYWESVRSIMYPGMSYNASAAALNSWYKLFLVPGAAHCSPNTAQPNGPFPQTNLAVLIDWVEKGIEPKTLNATVLQGEYMGENRQICGWPLRPLWTGNGTTMECVYDQPSIDTWHYNFDAFKMPVY
ncbi:feruloyl esteras-like protein B precursor [Glonium stellatum]|uniref:Carboxylic ester hydrolase n=1 Tax=Glonium stellatum TaxID=574774 RepID=A0A8E2FBT4_9PEZI|nr:feruloyl esteras-like protein B precursor [Glonium stellatum]